jgi:hypothetical protein
MDSLGHLCLTHPTSYSLHSFPSPTSPSPPTNLPSISSISPLSILLTPSTTVYSWDHSKDSLSPPFYTPNPHPILSTPHAVSPLSTTTPITTSPTIVVMVMHIAMGMNNFTTNPITPSHSTSTTITVFTATTFFSFHLTHQP